MGSQISTRDAMAIIGPLVHEVRLLKGEKYGMRSEYERLQRDLNRRGAIIDEQGKLLRFAGSAWRSKGTLAIRSSIERQPGDATQDTVALVEAPGPTTTCVQETGLGNKVKEAESADG